MGKPFGIIEKKGQQTWATFGCKLRYFVVLVHSSIPGAPLYAQIIINLPKHVVFFSMLGPRLTQDAACRTRSSNRPATREESADIFLLFTSHAKTFGGAPLGKPPYCHPQKDAMT